MKLFAAATILCRSCLVVMPLACCLLGCAREEPQPPPSPPSPGPLAMSPLIAQSVPAAGRRGILELDEQLPELQSEGWLNGEPPVLAPGESGLVVVDVWGRWCSEVPKSLPGLKRLHAEFAPRGVRFVSLTSEPRETVEAFVREHGIPWPNGYRASVDAINAIGALNPDMPLPGYEVKPLIYLATSDGTIVWSDRHQRMDHTDEDKTVLIATLRKELEARLPAIAEQTAR